MARRGSVRPPRGLSGNWGETGWQAKTPQTPAGKKISRGVAIPREYAIIYLSGWERKQHDNKNGKHRLRVRKPKPRVPLQLNEHWALRLLWLERVPRKPRGLRTDSLLVRGMRRRVRSRGLHLLRIRRGQNRKRQEGGGSDRRNHRPPRAKERRTVLCLVIL